MRRLLIFLLILSLFYPVFALEAQERIEDPTISLRTQQQAERFARQVAESCLHERGGWTHPSCKNILAYSIRSMVDNYVELLRTHGFEYYATRVQNACEGAMQPASAGEEIILVEQAQLYEFCSNIIMKTIRTHGFGPNLLYYRILITARLCMHGLKECEQEKENLRQYASR